MTLTKTDLRAIRQVLKPDFDSIDSRFNKLEKKIDKVDKKLDKKFVDLFNFLDRDASDLRIKFAQHLGIELSALTRSIN